jgi:hypothetical protein
MSASISTPSFIINGRKEQNIFPVAEINMQTKLCRCPKFSRKLILLTYVHQHFQEYLLSPAAFLPLFSGLTTPEYLSQKTLTKTVINI